MESNLAKIQKLTHEQLLATLRYEPTTGEFHWLVHLGRGGAGKPAGSIDGHGYRCIGIRGHDYKAHRLAWFYVHGTWPDLCLDHINGDRADNRLANLRQATPAQNNANAKQRSDQPVAKGVTFRKQLGKWQASIAFNGASSYLGVFNTPAEAASAYAAAAQQLYGEFARTA